jgi:hypothetical protein
MANTQQTEPTTIDLAPLGREGDTCASCGAALAVDQRYCLNCGERRAESRIDFEDRVKSNGAAVNGASAAAPSGAANGAASGATSTPQWNPLLAIGAIGLLGVMLLLGVLIGKDDNEPPVAAAPVTTTTAAEAAPPPTDAAAAAPAPDKAAAKGAGASDTAPGAGNVVQGGSGSTEGISTENPLEGKTGKDLVEAQKNAPDVIATDGEQAALDPNGKAGGGSGATCIGC